MDSILYKLQIQQYSDRDNGGKYMQAVLYLTGKLIRGIHSYIQHRHLDADLSKASTHDISHNQ